MIKSLVTLAALVLVLSANAAVFKCAGNDGKVQYSDTPCRVGVGSRSQPISERSLLNQQHRQDAVLKAEQIQSEAAALAENKAAEQANNRSSSQSFGAESRKLPSAVRTSDNEPNVYAICVRDVERTGASEVEKSKHLMICHGVGVR